MKLSIQKYATALFAVSIVLLVTLIIGSFSYIALGNKLEQTRADLGSKITNLEQVLSDTQLERTSLNDALAAEQLKNKGFMDEIERITGTVNTLEKLQSIDPELLQKYSKVFFLNENYAPKRLSKINEDFVFNKDRQEQILSQVNPFLRRLFDAAQRDGMHLQIISAYRSFATQATLKAGYKVVYGAGTANQFSAEQGFSEHQLGTTIDFTTESLGTAFEAFDKTPEFKWLTENAYRYGFILSYPKGNSYYQYEPWHWRFVGSELADDLHDDNKNFYDLDQRKIDQYLVNIFD